MTSVTRVSADRLESAARDILKAAGAHDQVAADVARTLVVTSLRGIDSHGIALLPRILARVEAGRCRIANPVKIAPGTEDKAVAVIEADLAPGQHAALAAARLAVDKARRFGIGYVAVRNSTHFGACTPYVLEVVRAGMVALAGSNSTMSMAAFDAPFVNLGNNPIGFGAPVAGGSEMVFDFSCGVMSFGRLKKLRAEGGQPPPGAFVKPAVRPGGDPVYEVAGSLSEAALPFGGHKGAGVALMVEVLAGVLGGGFFGAETETMKDGTFLGPSHFVLAVAPENLIGDALAARMRRYAEDIKGGADVRLPGDAAGAIELERSRDGILVEAALLARFGVTLSWNR